MQSAAGALTGGRSGQRRDETQSCMIHAGDEP
jgi:hypothetical protein